LIGVHALAIAVGRAQQGELRAVSPAERPVGLTGDRPLLIVGPAQRRLLERVLEQLAVGHVGDKRHGVGERRCRDHAVQQSGIVVRDEMLLHRAAGAAASDGSGTPNCSMKCSFTIIIVPAEMTSAQLVPNAFSDDDATA
jgi:hypothetical protein